MNLYRNETIKSNLQSFSYFETFDVLPNFLSPQAKRCTIITYKHGIYDLPSDLKPKILLLLLLSLLVLLLLSSLLSPLPLSPYKKKATPSHSQTRRYPPPQTPRNHPPPPTPPPQHATAQTPETANANPELDYLHPPKTNSNNYN